MSRVTLYCREVPGLKLGPGVGEGTLPVRGEEHLRDPGQVIVFSRGFASFDERQYPDWREWVNHPGTPPIEVLAEDSGLVPEGTPNAFSCEFCGKTFGAKIALIGHLRSHAP